MSRAWWETQYAVHRVGGTVTYVFRKKSEAVAFAKRQADHDRHGDWMVWKYGPFHRKKWVDTFDGHWSDWPEDWEDDE